MEGGSQSEKMLDEYQMSGCAVELDFESSVEKRNATKPLIMSSVINSLLASI